MLPDVLFIHTQNDVYLLCRNIRKINKSWPRFSYFDGVYLVTHIQIISFGYEKAFPAKIIIKFQCLQIERHRFYLTPLDELHVRLTALVDVSMMLNEHKCIHIFYRLKRYRRTYILTCTHQSTQIMQMELGDGMLSFSLRILIIIFSAILYKSDQFDTSHITIITKKEDKSRLAGVLLSKKEEQAFTLNEY